MQPLYGCAYHSYPPSHMTRNTFLLLLAAVLLLSCSNEKRTSRPEFDPTYPDVHDPVLAIGEDGRYYIFSTGVGVGVMSSADLKTWSQEPSVFDREAIPQWAKDTVPGYWGHTWAPDISYRNGQWHLYYSCSTFGKNGSAIGLAVNKTLDPKSPDFRWRDQGPVVVSHKGVTNWNAIEAPFIFKRSDWYYLLVSHDYCCRGKNSTYKVAYGRSQSITGPYLDRDGKDLAYGGGTLLVGPDERYYGVGHCSVYQLPDGNWYYISHAYDSEFGARAKLFIRPLQFSPDDWFTLAE